jgi:hypothetical protein
MVKVLENKLVDLDVVPGQEQIDLQRRFREQLQSAKGQGKEVELPEGAKVVEGQDGAKIASQQGFQIPRDMLPGDLSDEQKSQAKGFGGVVIDGSGKVISGLAGTVGGVLKGVGDTAGNTVGFKVLSPLSPLVYALVYRCFFVLTFSEVYGLGKTGQGLVTGLAGTAKAPFTGTAPGKQASAPGAEAQPGAGSVDDPEDTEGAARRKPRKIELRSGGGEPAAEPAAAGQTVED